MSRAFVKEDDGNQAPKRFYGLPPEGDPSYDAAAAMALLEAARDGELPSAEEATGFRFGDVQLHPHVRKLLAKEEARPEEEQDRRFIRMAYRFLDG